MFKTSSPPLPPLLPPLLPSLLPPPPLTPPPLSLRLAWRASRRLLFFLCGKIAVYISGMLLSKRPDLLFPSSGSCHLRRLPLLPFPAESGKLLLEMLDSLKETNCAKLNSCNTLHAKLCIYPTHLLPFRIPPTGSPPPSPPLLQLQPPPPPCPPLLQLQPSPPPSLPLPQLAAGAVVSGSVFLTCGISMQFTVIRA